MQSNPILILSVTASEDITAHRFVAPGGSVPDAGGNTLGAAMADTLTGQSIPVVALGTAIVEAAGNIAANALVESDADGKAVTLDTGEVAGRALQAGAAGRKIEILLHQN